jgi:threonine dehydratase
MTQFTHPAVRRMAGDAFRALDTLRMFMPPSPLQFSPALSDLTGCAVMLKREDEQPTGSFKIRGALNAVSRELDRDPRTRFVTASAGNHGQALAYWCKKFGAECVVVAPVHAAAVKVAACQRWGATVVRLGETLGEAEGVARELYPDHYFVSPFAHGAVVAGQGTMAFEMLEQLPDIDAIIVPVGGGGLLAGVGSVLHVLSPNTKILAAEPENWATFGAFRRSQPLVERPTIADGLAVSRIGEVCQPILNTIVDGYRQVTEDRIKDAMRRFADLGIRVEGAGATGLAALMHDYKDHLQDQTVMLIVTGNNVDPEVYADVVVK